MIADSAKPIMIIKIDMEKGKKITEKNKLDFGEVVNVEGNVVSVKLDEGRGYEYAFFNDVDIEVYAERDDKNEYTGMYILTIN